MDALPSELLKSGTAISSLVLQARDHDPDAVKHRAIDSETGRRDTGVGGAGRDRTDDPLLAKQVLSQLSYSPA